MMRLVVSKLRANIAICRRLVDEISVGDRLIGSSEMSIFVYLGAVENVHTPIAQ